MKKFSVEIAAEVMNRDFEIYKRKTIPLYIQKAQNSVRNFESFGMAGILSGTDPKNQQNLYFSTFSKLFYPFQGM